MEWKIIDFNKIPGETPFDAYSDAISRYKFSQIINYSKDIFFLLGDNSAENPNSASSIIYRSVDFGATFHKTTLGRGTITEGCFAEEGLFVVLQSSNFAGEERKNISTLFHSKDWGETWEKITHLDEVNLSYIDFYSQKTGIAVFSVKKAGEFVYEYRYTKDGGKTWIKFDLDPEKICILNSDHSLLYIENNDQLYQFDLEDGKKRLVNSLPIPQDMKLIYIKKDKKTSRLVAYYFGKERESYKVGICYIDKGEYIPLPDGYYITTYGDFYFTEVYNTPYSSYVWSEDGGKIWNKEELKDFFIVPRPIGYADEGYIYMIVTMFKGKEENRGARLVIGYPKKNS